MEFGMWKNVDNEKEIIIFPSTLTKKSIAYAILNRGWHIQFLYCHSDVSYYVIVYNCNVT
jgi:hypothetical protein